MWFKKYHFFHISFVERTGEIRGITKMQRTPFINDYSMNMARVELEMPADAPVVSVSYLGRMTIKQWNMPRD